MTNEQKADLCELIRGYLILPLMFVAYIKGVWF